jgi:hypothetical protein
MKKPMRHIRNWSEYNASLKQRGSLAIWVSSEAVENWTTDELRPFGKRPLISGARMLGQLFIIAACLCHYPKELTPLKLNSPAAPRLRESPWGEILARC